MESTCGLLVILFMHSAAAQSRSFAYVGLSSCTWNYYPSHLPSCGNAL